jgi:phage terminase large subunit-like protein
MIETGKCMFPNNNPPWLEPFLRELFVFPNGRYDDQADALSQGLAYLSKGRSHSTFGD